MVSAASLVGAYLIVGPGAHSISRRRLELPAMYCRACICAHLQCTCDGSAEAALQRESSAWVARPHEDDGCHLLLWPKRGGVVDAQGCWHQSR